MREWYWRIHVFECRVEKNLSTIFNFHIFHHGVMNMFLMFLRLNRIRRRQHIFYCMDGADPCFRQIKIMIMLISHINIFFYYLFFFWFNPFLLGLSQIPILPMLSIIWTLGSWPTHQPLLAALFKFSTKIDKILFCFNPFHATGLFGFQGISKETSDTKWVNQSMSSIKFF